MSGHRSPEHNSQESSSVSLQLQDTFEPNERFYDTRDDLDEQQFDRFERCGDVDHYSGDNSEDGLLTGQRTHPSLGISVKALTKAITMDTLEESVRTITSSRKTQIHDMICWLDLEKQWPSALTELIVKFEGIPSTEASLVADTLRGDVENNIRSWVFAYRSFDYAVMVLFAVGYIFWRKLFGFVAHVAMCVILLFYAVHFYMLRKRAGNLCRLVDSIADNSDELRHWVWTRYKVAADASPFISIPNREPFGKFPALKDFVLIIRIEVFCYAFAWLGATPFVPDNIVKDLWASVWFFAFFVCIPALYFAIHYPEKRVRWFWRFNLIFCFVVIEVFRKFHKQQEKSSNSGEGGGSSRSPFSMIFMGLTCLVWFAILLVTLTIYLRSPYRRLSVFRMLVATLPFLFCAAMFINEIVAGVVFFILIYTIACGIKLELYRKLGGYHAVVYEDAMSRGVLKMWLILLSPLLPSHWCFPQDIMAGRAEDIHIPDIPDRGLLSQFYAYFSDLSDGYLNEHRGGRDVQANNDQDN